MLELRLKKMAYSKQLFMLLLACSTLLLIVFKASAAHTGSASDPLPIDSEDDLYKMAECMKYNKSWSNGKNFSLNCDIELKTSIELSNGAEGYMFCGKFHGNGHTLTLSGGSPLFSTIGEGGYVENLVIKGAGYIAGENKGSIEIIVKETPPGEICPTWITCPNITITFDKNPGKVVIKDNKGNVFKKLN